MTNEILLFESSFHLGDNPGTFLNANYIGHRLALPVKKTWHDANALEVKFSLFTHDVETWGSSLGHALSVNGNEIGRLKDASNVQGQSERYDILVPTTDLIAMLGGNDNFELSVELERSAANPGLADDFVLNRITTEALALSLGWK